MSFTFNDGIPAPNNDPSVDQPDLLQNNVSINGILAVDHISFNAQNGGTHLQAHLPFFTNPVVIDGQATEGGLIYTSAGVADPSRAEAFFKNNYNVPFPMSCIKAFGAFTASGNPPSFDNSFNCASIAGANPYVITLTANAVIGNDVIVIPFSNSLSGVTAQGGITYSFINPTLTLNLSAPGANQKVAFIVLQA